MKYLSLTLLFLTFGLFANDGKIPSKIKSVTVYLNGAQIKRTVQCQLKSGTNELVFTGLSHKVDESSIQVSGLKSVSILSMEYDINFLEKSESNPEVRQWEVEMDGLEFEIALLKNTITGLEEEEKVITANRQITGDNQTLDLDKVKQLGQYYRERMTAIKNEIFKNELKVKELQKELEQLEKQLQEVNTQPQTEQGELTITFDAPISITLDLTLSYYISDAGWVPNYDIKSTKIGEPLSLAYKANVYQNTGKDWENVNVVLSTGNPNYNISKPKVETHFLDFTSAYNRRYTTAQKKKGYAFNPSVKKVAGTVTDENGLPLPGVNVLIKGTTTGTQTDFDGDYSLDVPYGQELTFSYIGMHQQEIPIYASIINVDLEEDATQLDEVVVTAMGVKRERNSLGYAVSNVAPERVLSGSTPGIKIRGISSFSSGNQPLYIIDGVPLDGFTEGDLDASEIQDVTILKAADAKLYGSRGTSGVILITTKKSSTTEGATKTEFAIKKLYSITSDGDITVIEINTFKMAAEYEYFSAPIINENVFLTARFSEWEKHQLLPGEANIYFEGAFAGKTVLDPYVTQKEIVLSLGIDPNIKVTRSQDRNFKSKTFTGSNRILDRTYNLDIKNNKNIPVSVKIVDRIPKSQNKEIKIDNIVANTADYDKDKGLLTWKLKLDPQENKTESFSFQVKYPRGRYISL